MARSYYPDNFYPSGCYTHSMYTNDPKSGSLKALAAVEFHGDSLEVLRGFPGKVKDDLGYALYQLQRGQTPADSRPMAGLGGGVFELREQDERSWYRVIYYRKIKDVIHVLHCFEKRSAKTPPRDRATVRNRLQRLLQEGQGGRGPRAGRGQRPR